GNGNDRRSRGCCRVRRHRSGSRQYDSCPSDACRSDARSDGSRIRRGHSHMSRHPDWLKVRIPGGENFFEVRRILRSHKLNTICEDAMCPNIAECWGKHRTATFMILGDICTRACAFCAVTSGKPTELDLMEPARGAAAIADLKLKHAVITSVA